MNSLTLEGLRTFLAFSETLNFTHAADRLCISQPALFTRIQELSKTLGVALYHKQGRQLQLTSKGQELARFAREMEQRSEDFLDHFQDRNPDRPVVLAAGQGAYLYLLGPGLQTYLNREHHQPLQLLTTSAPETLEAIRDGRAHLGVGSFRQRCPELKFHPLCSLEQVLVLPKRHPLSRKKSLLVCDLEGLSLVVPPSGRPLREHLNLALAAAGVTWRVAVEAEGWELLLKFVSLGLGLAVVNSFCKIPTGFVTRPILDLARVPYHLVHSPTYFRPEAATLMEDLRQGLQSHQSS